MPQIIVKVNCITDLHVGNGDVNYNIIDNEVEKDPITGYPMIHASGVKGALREYFEKHQPKDVNDIFGADTPGQTSAGKLKFLNAEMLAIPMRASAGEKPYYLVSTKTAWDRFKSMYAMFLNKDVEEKIIACDNVEVESIKPTAGFETPYGTIYLIKERDGSKKGFQTVSLPVVARNRLEDGISKNLWYEEFVPHESIFFFAVLADEKDNSFLEAFKKAVKDAIVQFGGNASVGCGFCKLEILE